MSSLEGGFTDNSKSFAKKYASTKIKSYTVGRTPIQEFIGKYISGKYKNLPYDKLFHLFIILELDPSQDAAQSGAVATSTAVIFILTEKNPDTIFKKVDGNVIDNRGAESFLVPLVYNPPTYGEFIENLRKLQGKRFNQYDALKNNCQDYVLDCVNALYGVTDVDIVGRYSVAPIGANPEITAFIKQDVSDIFYGADFKFAKFITDTYGSIKSLFGGVATPGQSSLRDSKIGLPFDPRYSYHDPTVTGVDIASRRFRDSKMLSDRSRVAATADGYGNPTTGGFDRAKYTGITKNLETGEEGVRWKKHKGGLSLHWRAPEATKKIDLAHYYPRQDGPVASPGGSLGKWHWV